MYVQKKSFDSSVFWPSFRGFYFRVTFKEFRSWNFYLINGGRLFSSRCSNQSIKRLVQILVLFSYCSLCFACDSVCSKRHRARYHNFYFCRYINLVRSSLVLTFFLQLLVPLAGIQWSSSFLRAVVVNFLFFSLSFFINLTISYIIYMLLINSRVVSHKLHE